MNKKLSLIMFLLITAGLILAACQRTTPTDTDCTADQVLCVGLVTGLDGISDRSFNQLVWEGIQQAEAELGVRAEYIHTEDAKDYSSNMQAFIDQGYDSVITVGPEMGTVTREVAAMNPDVKFIGVEQAQDDILPNLAGLVFREDHAGFLAGSLSAQMTRSGIIAAVLGLDTLPSSMDFKQGFEAGARHVNPTVQTITNFYPGASAVDLTEARWGASSAADAIQQGADVVFAAGGRVGLGALLESANHPGVYCIGADIDQWETVPDAQPCLLTSAAKRLSQGVFDLVRLAKDGSFPGGNYHGTVELAPFHDFDSLIPQPVRNTLKLITDGLSDGSINTSPGTP